jgi:hypothetical protein
MPARGVIYPQRSRENAMSSFYPLLTLISIVVFGWLGRHLALKRNRNGLIWGVGGALLPPVLLLLFVLPAAKAEDGDGDEAADLV